MTYSKYEAMGDSSRSPPVVMVVAGLLCGEGLGPSLSHN